MSRKKAERAIAYYRVSTVRQGQSGLGLEAQRASVEALCKARGMVISAEYRDVESGRHDDRPGLDAALKACKAQGARLVIAKIDRLARRASFVLRLQDSGVPFTACDVPDMNETVVGILALIAQAEAKAVSERTRAALAAARARGVRLGSPTNNLDDAAREKARQAKRRKALSAANGAIHHAQNYRRAGWSLRAIAKTFNESGMTTRRGKLWTAVQVGRLLRMAGKQVVK